MSIFTRTAVISFLITLNALNADSEITRLELYFGIAKGDYLIGNLQGANKGVKQILKIDPDYIPALTLDARIQIDQGQPELALESVERAIALESQNFEHQFLKAIVLGNMGQKDDAIRTVEKIIQSTSVDDKEHQMASKLLGLLLMAQSDWDMAAKVFNQSYSNNPEPDHLDLELAIEACLNKAEDALRKDDFDTAIESVTQALKFCKESSHTNGFEKCIELRMLRSQILTQTGRIDKAIADLQYISAQQPDNFEALITLASIYASTERWDSLQGILTPIAANSQLQDIALYFEGRIALANERVGTAREKFEAALRLLPDSSSQLFASIEFYQAICFEKIGRFAESNAKIIQSLKSGFRPETVEETIIACRALIRAGENSRAITLLEALAINHSMLPPEVWNLLGRAHMANDSTTLALSAFNQSLSIKPAQSETLALRGSLLRKIGDLKGAATDMENALDIKPENPAVIYSLGLIYFQLGDLINARRLIGQSAQQLPDNSGIQLLHALLAYNTNANKDVDRALKTYLASHTTSQINESAFYLEYVLTAEKDPLLAAQTLHERIQSTKNATPMLRNFLAYTQDKLDRKAVLDAAGHAESPEAARKQLCEAAYWLAQHERIHQRTEKANELLRLAIQIGSADYSEYLFAQWQLK